MSSSSAIVDCPLGCGARFALTSFHDHCALECPFIEINCPSGCGARIQRRLLSQHVRECQRYLSFEYLRTSQGIAPHTPPMRRHESPQVPPRSASSPVSPIADRSPVLSPAQPASVDASPQALATNAIGMLPTLLERGAEAWNQIQAMFPHMFTLFNSGLNYWNRVRASDERMWLAGNIFLGLIMAYMFLTPVIFILKCGILAFILFSCWNTIGQTALGQQPQYRGAASILFALLAVYLIKVIL